jgi:hypothetical protein
MPSSNVRRAQAANASGDSGRLDELLTEPEAASATSGEHDASSQPALFRVATEHRAVSVRLIDLERRARFGRFGFGAV